MDYVGRFEVLEIAATKTANGALRSTKLRLQSTILRQAADENSRVFPEAVALARAPEVAKLRALEPGQAFGAELTLPASVRVGDSVIVFLTYSTGFRVWADAYAQGVFVRNGSGLMENSMIYFGDGAISEASLLSEIDRGSQLARAGSSCDVGSVVALPSDAGR